MVLEAVFYGSRRRCDLAHLRDVHPADLAARDGALLEVAEGGRSLHAAQGAGASVPGVKDAPTLLAGDGPQGIRVEPSRTGLLGIARQGRKVRHHHPIVKLRILAPPDLVEGKGVERPATRRVGQLLRISSLERRGAKAGRVISPRPQKRGAKRPFLG